MQRAGESYEALMTQVRPDLGDRISKAFANVDSLISEMGLDLNDENRRHVRILAYNRMEISIENIDKVAEADKVVTDVIGKMKPAAVLDMIRNGINPLEKTFDELAAMAGEVSEDAESATEGFEFDRPVKITLMYRVDDCAFARGYADVENMTGTADGDLFGSETPVKMTVDGIITLSVDDMEGKVVIPDELPTENPMEQTEAAVPAAEGGVAMTIDGKEIAVPSRARAIAESGWTIEKEYSGDEQVEPDSLTYVKFAKDDMDLTAFVYNVGDETADALDCEIYELSFMKGYGDAANDAQILGGLVKIGMSEAEVAAALDGAGIKYEKEDQQNGYCYYEIPMGGDSVGYEIGLNEDEGVWQIQARNETVWN